MCSDIFDEVLRMKTAGFWPCPTSAANEDLDAGISFEKCVGECDACWRRLGTAPVADLTKPPVTFVLLFTKYCKTV